MGNRFLLAVDDSVHSRHAVAYVARMTMAAEETTYTLFSLQAVVPQVLREAAESHPDAKAEVDRLTLQGREASRSLVASLKELMIAEGVPEKRIELVFEPIDRGMAKDILSRAETGAYDAIVIARKGLTPSRDFFIGTLAAKVAEHAQQTPVWIVDGTMTSLDVLVAVDGSENSLRDLDHVIKTLGANPDLRMTLFHVLPYLRHYYSLEFETQNPLLQDILQRADNRRMEEFYGKARERLEKAGLGAGQFRTRISKRSYDISTAILDEARNEAYGTIVMGRRGERSAFFTGRIAMRLIQKVSGKTLWLIP